MKIKFYKMTGAGNDFIMFDNRNGLIKNPPKLAQWVCDRHFGVGADGIILIEKSKTSDFKMVYFNSDGSFGGMCGNGGRCIAKLAYEMGIAKKETTFEANGKFYKAEILSNDRVKLYLPAPKTRKLNLKLKLGKKFFKAHFIDTGAPHLVVFTDENKIRNIEKININTLGRKLRFHPYFENGTNVNFVSIIDENTIRMRTYERGVEGETLACGTGSVASALISSEIKNLTPPIKVKATSGEILTVGWNIDKKFVYLEGTAKIICEGTINYDD
ncbi:MAG: diaminopimelate epimerase [Candidatus Kryptonium sp.]|nr:diaminopimelate epimerase [Candidatus Kryptonium sp.]MDW8108355.1 diaminopimelate epimerase [Candidatus Kryptonium sp.]